MKSSEFIAELELSNPVKYTTVNSDQYTAFIANLPIKADMPKKSTDTSQQKFAAAPKPKEADVLSVFFGVNRYRGVTGDTLEISFTVNDRIDMTGVGNPVQIFGAVSYIIKQELPKFLKSNPEIIKIYMAADLKEKTRVSFYSKRIVPRMNELLGSNWVPYQDVRGKYMKFSWTKGGEIQDLPKSKKEKRGWSLK